MQNAIRKFTKWSIVPLFIALFTTAFTGSLCASPNDFGQPHIGAVKGRVPVLPKVQVINFGKAIYTGAMDVNPTLQRIRAGRRLRHRNDGSIFGNREKRLPVQRDREYYREFVHQMRKMPFPGPQRVMIGKQGEVYYTGDHYASFTLVNPK